MNNDLNFAKWTLQLYVATITYFHLLLCCIVLFLKGWSFLPNALQSSQDLLCSPEFRY